MHARDFYAKCILCLFSSHSLCLPSFLPGHIVQSRDLKQNKKPTQKTYPLQHILG